MSKHTPLDFILTSSLVFCRLGRAFRGAIPISGVSPQSRGVCVSGRWLGRAVRGGAAAGHGPGRSALQRSPRVRTTRAKTSPALRTHVPSLYRGEIPV